MFRRRTFDTCRPTPDNWLATAQRDIARSDSFCTGPINAGLTTGVSAPAVKPAQPTVFLNEDEQLEQLHRCLTDSTIDIDLLAGGALMLLYESI